MHHDTRLHAHSLILLVGCVMAAVTSQAEVELRFSLPDTTFEVGTQGRLSVMLDQEQEFLLLDVLVWCDPEVLSSIGGSAGQGPIDTGYVLFERFASNESGYWRGLVCIMGGLMTGPGELFVWDFEATASGTTSIDVVDVTYYATHQSEPEIVMLPSTIVHVTDGVTAVPDADPAKYCLTAYPNPFNPLITISYDLPHTTPVLLAVYDLSGRLVRKLETGVMEQSGRYERVWNGRDARDRAMPSGYYIVRLETDSQVEARKVMLIR